MKLPIHKKDGPIFVADIQQLKHKQEKISKKPLILAGQLFLCSLEPLIVQSGFIAQPPRKLNSQRFTTTKKTGTTTLNLALDAEVLTQVSRLKAKPIFAIDCLLKYGLKLKSKDDSVVIAAFEATLKTQLSVLVFKKNNLVSFQEFETSHPAAHTHEADLHVLIERLKLAHPSAQFHWCGPLLAPSVFNMVDVPDSIWSSGPTQTLTATGKASSLSKHGTPFLLATLAIAGYFGVLFQPYQEYQESANLLKSQSAQLQGQYSFASERLSLLAARKDFFKTQSEIAPKLSKIEKVLSALSSIPTKVVVKEAKMTLSKPVVTGNVQQSGIPRDFEVTLEVEKNDDINAILQSEPILKHLSDTLGANVRLATESGHKEFDNPSTGKKGTRQYKIQGDFRAN